MYNYVAIALLILGLVLLFSVDTVIDKNTSNSTLKSIYDNKYMVGALCIGFSYSAYLMAQKEMNHIPVFDSQGHQVELEVPSQIPHVGEKLPTYDESISTSEALNL